MNRVVYVLGRILLTVLSVVAGGWILGSRAEAPIEIRLGTLIPSGTSYHRSLLELGEKWRTISGGMIKLTVYPDGRQGGEAAMVRKMNAGNLNAGLLTAVGLSEIADGVACLQKMPMTFRDWDEFDYVREKVRPELERRLQSKGYEVLFWADAGWVRFFSKSPGAHPDDFKAMKLFVWSGDERQINLMKRMGYRPQGLETADILPGLSTGLIDAVPVPPFVALAGQFDGKAKYMLDVRWAPIIGAAVLKRDLWERVPSEQRPALRTAASSAGDALRAQARKEDIESIAALEKRGLKVQPGTEPIVAEWRQLAESVHPEIRGAMVPAELFDQVQQLLRERRSGAASSKP